MKISELRLLQASANRFDDYSVVFDRPYMIVDLDESDNSGSLLQPNCPVIAMTDNLESLPAIVDIPVQDEQEMQIIKQAVRNSPVAATILVQLLRHNEQNSVAQGLFAESLSYSCLQNGTQFQNWLVGRVKKPKPHVDSSQLVLMERNNDHLDITLNRPEKRNAYSAELRDELNEALLLVHADSSIKRATIASAGECFSAGGDLDEFGSAKDGAYAHITRLTRNNGVLLDELRGRVEFRLHGACIGAGIEMPSFVDHVIADSNSFFQLPEVAMGLIPGAGGTVSILKRIGRLKTAFMAISNQRITAEKALSWGLIDEISG